MKHMNRIAPLKVKAIVMTVGITLAACSTFGKAPSICTHPDLVTEAEVISAVN